MFFVDRDDDGLTDKAYVAERLRPPRKGKILLNKLDNSPAILYPRATARNNKAARAMSPSRCYFDLFCFRYRRGLP